MDLLFTRALIASGSSDATKDAQCVAELGAEYRAASLLDVQALYRSPFRAGPQFTAAAHSQAVYITPSDPFLVFSFGAVNSLQVACARF
jgi:hypothetical protein